MQYYTLNAAKTLGLPFGHAETNGFAVRLFSYLIRQNRHLLKQRKGPIDGEEKQEK